VIRHAHAQNVSVHFEQKAGDRVSLTIRDDGKGFDPSLALARWDGNSRLGLAGMQERVRLLGGEIEIKSGGGEGTQIDVYFPSNTLVPTSI
jgi:signal transduction histidine kinase